MTKRSGATAALSGQQARRAPTQPSHRRTSSRQSQGLQRQRVWVVSDELPRQIPVLPGEVNVIETYLGDLLSELLSD